MKFTKLGYIAKQKKDPKKFNLVLEEGGVKRFLSLKGKPTEAEVEANPKLAGIAEKWPEWKIYDILEISDD